MKIIINIFAHTYSRCKENTLILLVCLIFIHLFFLSQNYETNINRNILFMQIYFIYIYLFFYYYLKKIKSWTILFVIEPLADTGRHWCVLSIGVMWNKNTPTLDTLEGLWNTCRIHSSVAMKYETKAWRRSWVKCLSRIDFSFSKSCCNVACKGRLVILDDTKPLIHLQASATLPLILQFLSTQFSLTSHTKILPVIKGADIEK